MERPHVLQYELRGVAVLAVDVPLDIEADNIVAFGEQALGPAAEAAIPRLVRVCKYAWRGASSCTQSLPYRLQAVPPNNGIVTTIVPPSLSFSLASRSILTGPSLCSRT